MQIKLTHLRRINHPKVKAVASILIDDALAVHDIKLLTGPHGFWVAMPDQPDKDGIYRDVVHPINAELRRQLTELIVKQYENLGGKTNEK